MQFSRSFEYKRKERLLYQLFSQKIENRQREYNYWLTSAQLNQILQEWDSNTKFNNNLERIDEIST